MNKYVAVALILLTIGIMAVFQFCSFDKKIDGLIKNVPASWGQYEIDTVTNEVLLQKLYPDAEHSGCGLSDDAFIKYAMDRIDHSQKFQFIVFTRGKPLVGKRCLRTALIFYLKD